VPPAADCGVKATQECSLKLPLEAPLRDGAPPLPRSFELQATSAATSQRQRSFLVATSSPSFGDRAVQEEGQVGRTRRALWCHRRQPVNNAKHTKKRKSTATPRATGNDAGNASSNVIATNVTGGELGTLGETGPLHSHVNSFIPAPSAGRDNLTRPFGSEAQTTIGRALTHPPSI